MHHGSVLLVLSFAAFWEYTSVDAEVDDEKNGENEHNNGDDADDNDLHCCKERPIRQNSSLLFLLIILQPRSRLQSDLLCSTSKLSLLSPTNCQLFTKKYWGLADATISK